MKLALGSAIRALLERFGDAAYIEGWNGKSCIR